MGERIDLLSHPLRELSTGSGQEWVMDVGSGAGELSYLKGSRAFPNWSQLGTEIVIKKEKNYV